MAPLLIILITIAGLFLGEEAARGEIAAHLNDFVGPESAAAVQEAVRRARISETGLLPTLLGVAALLLGATTVFAQLQASLNQIWDVVARPSRSSVGVFVAARLASFGLVLVIGFLLLTSFVISISIAAVIQFADEWVPVPGIVVSGIDSIVSLAIATILFAMMFKLLPDVQLQWRDMRRGAFITALLFVGGQSMISLYLTRMAPASSYGAAGSLVMVLLWVYYSSLIVVFGAAFTRATLRARGDVVVPKPTAVRVKVEIVEDVEG
ncbi:MAG: YihY/virulence factor BrkB family protein [Acidobacteria bacterium]|nr:YihY/virulence factor BrkB family protein [Acidobacteriota bacterium]